MFHEYWQKKLVPLWSSFPHIIELQVLREVESDNPMNSFPLVMVMKFASREDIEKALNSPIRWQSKTASKKLIEMFDGEIIHTVFSASEFNSSVK